MERTETYKNLYHGTDEESAEKILENGFRLSESVGNWCGAGVYFYDVKAKAWWSASRTCKIIKEQRGVHVKPAIICADILDLPVKYILDLRADRDLSRFEKWINELLSPNNCFEIHNIPTDVEEKIALRSLLLDFYATKTNAKLVIGLFQQRDQKEHEHMIEFADTWMMQFGVETIYCVKNKEILSNIECGGKSNG